MKITHAQIKNFRALKYIDVPLNQFSIILGENDVGKTSFIYALQSFFAGKKLDKQDWYKQDDTNPIEITLSLKGVSDNVEAKDSLRKDRTMTIQGCFSSGESPKFFEVLDDGSKSEIKSAAMKKLSLGEHFIFIPVSRDIGTQLSMAKTALLGKMMRARMNQAIEEKGANKLIEEITEILRESVQGPRKKMESFLREQLKNNSINLSFDDMHLNPIEGVNINVRLSDDKVDNIDIHNRGAGTQNNLIIALFRFVAESDMKEDFIFCLEEPENSLHPKAQRQLLSVIQDISESTQVLVTTHSPVFIDRSQYSSNIMFSRTSKGNTEAKIFNEELLAEVRDELGIRPSDALLKGGGNCALLVEGKTEEEGFPVFMDMMGISEFELGVAIISMEGSDKVKVKNIIKLLNSYAIPCVVVLDKDAQGTKEDLERMQHPERLGNLKKVFCLSKGTIEDYYPHEIIVQVINDKLNPSSEINIADVNTELRGKENYNQYDRLLKKYKAASIKYMKVQLGDHGTKLMKKQGLPVDDEIQKIINFVKSVATDNS